MTEDQKYTAPLSERWPEHDRGRPYGRIWSGYVTSPDNKNIIIPDEKQVAIYEEAFDYIDKGHSIREVTDWANQKLKKMMVHQTIYNLYKKHRKPFLAKKTQRKTRPKLSNATKKILSAQKTAEHAVRKAEKTVQKIRSKKRSKVAEKLEPLVEASERQEKAIQVFPDAPVPAKILFKPNPGPQTQFLSATEEEVLYGGGAGGEPKSWFSASFRSNASK